MKKLRVKVDAELDEATLLGLIRALVREKYKAKMRAELNRLESRYLKAFHDAVRSGKVFRFDERQFWKDITGEPA